MDYESFVDLSYQERVLLFKNERWLVLDMNLFVLLS